MEHPFANPLLAVHEQAEASFLPFGSDLRIVESYGEMEAEYAAIRKSAALMDAPHRAVVILTGRDRLAFLHNKLTNDIQRLAPGQGCYAYLLNLKGRIVLDMNVLQTQDATLVELDRRLAGEFLRTMDKYIFTEDVRLQDGSQQFGRLTVVGPAAAEVLGRVLDRGIETLIDPLAHGRRSIGTTTVTVFRNDLLGEPQYELIVPRDQLVELWRILIETNGGGVLRTRAIGWSAYNMARIEAASPMLGIDFSDAYLPMETAHWYGRAVSLTKGCYIGQEIVARMHAHRTVARMLVGLRIEGAGLPLAGTAIFVDDGTQGAGRPGEGTSAGQQAGIVTSSCLSPMLGNVPVALGYVKKMYAEVGKKVEVSAEGSRVKAEVAGLPLWRRS